MEHHSNELSEYVAIVDKLIEKVEDTKSPSLIKSMEHNVYKVDQTLVRCHTFIFLIDESKYEIAKSLGYQEKPKKKLLN
jgi:hypothetical protein